jgi:hypothetical protein
MPYNQMPVYARDHATYIKQMHEWHMKMHHYHDQLRAYHMDQVTHYHKMMGEKVKVAEISKDDNVA